MNICRGSASEEITGEQPSGQRLDQSIEGAAFAKSVKVQRLIARGLKVDPGLGAGYFNLGLALHQQARCAEATKAYRLALSTGWAMNR